MNTLNAKDYSKRSELEDAVKSLVGLTAERKSEYVISGTTEELARLQLSGSTSFWGIGCVDTIPVETKDSPPEKPVRGEIFPFGIAGKEELKKPK